MKLVITDDSGTLLEYSGEGENALVTTRKSELAMVFLFLAAAMERVGGLPGPSKRTKLRLVEEKPLTRY